MPSSIRVLVVDDEASIRNSMVAYLQDCQFDVISVESAEEALGRISHTPVDVALVDIRLPEMNGDAFILKAHEQHPAMQFLIHTGSVEYKLPDALKRVGVTPDHVFPKPQPDLSVFAAAIHKLMAGRD
jgi:DNA-binding NtrC family response regulator